MILFGDNDPWHFGTVPVACLTLFHSSTLDGWFAVMMINIRGCSHDAGLQGVNNLYIAVSGPKPISPIFTILCRPVAALSCHVYCAAAFVGVRKRRCIFFCATSLVVQTVQPSQGKGFAARFGGVG